jgi:hypothetical protein
LSFPFAKNPRNRLSGDQKGNEAPSVPVSGWADTPASGRTHSMFAPEEVATKAMRRPSGESAIGPAPNAKLDFSGGSKDDRTTRGGSLRRRKIKAVAAAAASAATGTSAHASFSRLLRFAATGAGSPTAEPPSAIHWSWSLTSCAVWNRSSGSLARQVFTTRSSAGGVIGWIEEMASGCVWMIAAMSDAWLLPENAFLPVAVS